MSSNPIDEPMTQEQARQLAHELNTGGRLPVNLIAVARPIPTGSWGGTEQAWGVGYFPIHRAY